MSKTKPFKRRTGSGLGLKTSSGHHCLSCCDKVDVCLCEGHDHLVSKKDFHTSLRDEFQINRPRNPTSGTVSRLDTPWVAGINVGVPPTRLWESSIPSMSQCLLQTSPRHRRSHHPPLWPSLRDSWRTSPRQVNDIGFICLNSLDPCWNTVVWDYNQKTVEKYPQNVQFCVIFFKKYN